MARKKMEKVIEVSVSKIKTEIRCPNCGKLFYNFFKKRLDTEKSGDIMTIRCTRCGVESKHFA